MSGLRAAAQKPPADTAKRIVVDIDYAKRNVGIQTDSGMMMKLIDSVQLHQGETLMYCDSTYLNLALNNLEAFGNVRIIQPGGTQITSDYLRYTGNKKLAYLQGNVTLTDGKSNLWSQDLTYDLGSKTGVYTSGGTLQSETTTLSSNSGVYNLRTKDARFTGEVYVTDPKYDVTSDDLGYNTGSKLVRFFGPSVVTNDKSVLKTSCGTYDSKNEIAHFTCRSSIRNMEQYIEADKIDYNRITGFGKADGRVMVIDTIKHTTLWSGYASYNEKNRNLLAYIKPVLRRENGKDSLFIRADTFFSAPELIRQSKKPAADTMVAKTNRKSGKKIPEEAPQEIPDSSAPRYFIGHPHVLIFSDSLQGRCDSISYSQRDSVMRMIKNPVLWSRLSQISGDTILMFTDDSNRIRKLFVPDKALVVSVSGPLKAGLYDQVQGKTLTGHFNKNTIREMIVWPEAECIYYAKDDNGAYLGVNQAQSERMKILFRDEKIRRILFEQDVKQSMTPLEKANIGAMRLSRFKWLDEERPKSREELFQ